MLFTSLDIVSFLHSYPDLKFFLVDSAALPVILVLLAVTVCIGLGYWGYKRHQEGRLSMPSFAGKLPIPAFGRGGGRGSENMNIVNNGYSN